MDVLADLAPRATAQPCSIHHRHGPVPTYCELHHVIPQAWQAAWQPSRPWPDEGKSPDRPGLVLWDARTVAICRTGHGNVHFWLVLAMRGYLEAREVGAALHLARENGRARGLIPAAADFEVASQALARWQAVGGSLDLLVSRSLWGQI